MPPKPVLLRRGDALVDALALYRRRAARRLGAPPWRVLPNATLVALARGRPRTRGELAAIPGFGPTRLARHGRAILAILARAA